MFNANYWFVFWLVFVCLLIREGARAEAKKADKPASRLLRSLFRFFRDDAFPFLRKFAKRERGDDGGDE